MKRASGRGPSSARLRGASSGPFPVPLPAAGPRAWWGCSPYDALVLPACSGRQSPRAESLRVGQNPGSVAGHDEPFVAQLLRINGARMACRGGVRSSRISPAPSRLHTEVRLRRGSLRSPCCQEALGPSSVENGLPRGASGRTWPFVAALLTIIPRPWRPRSHLALYQANPGAPGVACHDEQREEWRRGRDSNPRWGL